MNKVVVLFPVKEEYLLDDEGGVRIFDEIGQAREFLVESGCSYEDAEQVQFLESCGTCRRCGSPLFKSLIPDYKYQCFNCDEDFYGFEQE